MNAAGLRILHLIHTPRLSGAEVLVRNLCEVHSRQGVRCGVASFNPSNDAFLDDAPATPAGAIEWFVPEAPQSRLGRLRNFHDAMSEFKPDVVLAHSVLPALYGRAALVFRANRPRFISVLHCASEDDYSDWKLCLTERALQSRTDAIVTVSLSAQQNYRRRFGDKIPSFVVPNGIALSASSYGDAERIHIRKALSVPNNHCLILQVGRLSEVKQQHCTLEAMLPVLKARPDTHLWFAGLKEDPEYAATLARAVEAAGLEDRVLFLGGRRDVPELLGCADAYVMPSLKEAHSVAFLEALASGVPIVAADISSFRFAARLPAVELVDPTNTDALRAAITAAMGTSRVTRDLSAYDIVNTADAYLNCVSYVLGRAQIREMERNAQ
ncbi:glycosyltransferase family 4 protein [Methylosinus sp. LW3]|uniref:glycosyltransferase family 4 protein n=1 Tax=Methylosinus sp. LW3 TaxID=107635 RepID=UPI0004B5A211|nr:glycosyltransferase family 4 protein [Methylosinus sp. LW3]